MVAGWRGGRSCLATAYNRARDNARGQCGEEDVMLYELRIYECLPGRLPALHQRFREVTGRMFAKHGIEVVGYWEDVVGESNRLTYLVRWASMAEREQKWGAFISDEEWIAARARSEADGPIVARVRNTLLRPTDYSPVP
jgi:hypothetical protein